MVDRDFATCHYNYEDVVTVMCTSNSNTSLHEPCKEIYGDALELNYKLYVSTERVREGGREMEREKKERGRGRKRER